MQWNRYVATGVAAACLALLAACGGGGDDADGGSGGGAAADFPLRAAYSGYANATAQNGFDAIVVVRSLGTCVGSATFVQSGSAAGSFRGLASVDSPQRLALTLSACNGAPVDPQQASASLDQVLHRDAAGSILGSTDDETISIARAPIVLPERVQVGDSGTLGTMDNIDKVSGASAGTTVISYRTTAGAAGDNSVQVAVTLASSAPGAQGSQLDINTYQLGLNGSLRLVRYEGSVDGNSVTIVAR